MPGLKPVLGEWEPDAMLPLEPDMVTELSDFMSVSGFNPPFQSVDMDTAQTFQDTKTFERVIRRPQSNDMPVRPKLADSTLEDSKARRVTFRPQPDAMLIEPEFTAEELVHIRQGSPVFEEDDMDVDYDPKTISAPPSVIFRHKSVSVDTQRNSENALHAENNDQLMHECTDHHSVPGALSLQSAPDMVGTQHHQSHSPDAETPAFGPQLRSTLVGLEELQADADSEKHESETIPTRDGIVRPQQVADDELQTAASRALTTLLLGLPEIQVGLWGYRWRRDERPHLIKRARNGWSHPKGVRCTFGASLRYSASPQAENYLRMSHPAALAGYLNLPNRVWIGRTLLEDPEVVAVIKCYEDNLQVRHDSRTNDWDLLANLPRTSHSLTIQRLYQSETSSGY